jgi:hypothetical protein
MEQFQLNTVRYCYFISNKLPILLLYISGLFKYDIIKGTSK